MQPKALRINATKGSKDEPDSKEINGKQSKQELERTQLEIIQQAEELKTARYEADRLTRLMMYSKTPNSQQAGVTTPGSNLNIPTSNRSNVYSNYLQSGFRPSENAQGRAREFEQMYNAAAVYSSQDDQGEFHHVKDESALKAYIAEERASEGGLNGLYYDFEQQLKGRGFLGGPGSEKASSTDINTIPSSFLTFASMMLRSSQTSQFIFHQFTQPVVRLGRRVGVSIQVPRFKNLNISNVREDYLLDTADMSVDISSQSQPMSSTMSEVMLYGWGLGKGNRIDNRPVSISQFISETSVHNLQEVLREKLAHNYYAVEDALLQELFSDTGYIFYNNNNQVLTRDPSQIVATADSTLSSTSLLLLAEEMQSRNTLPYDNGKYVLCINSLGSTKLNVSLDSQKNAFSRTNIEELSRIFGLTDIVEAGNVARGYIGDYGPFMIFQGSSYGVGNPGAKGVQDTIFGGAGGPQTTRSSYAFGKGAVGRAQTMPMQIAINPKTYGRGMSFIWQSIEGFDHIDAYNPGTDPLVASGVDNGQENRIFELRTSDVPVI